MPAKDEQPPLVTTPSAAVGIPSKPKAKDADMPGQRKTTPAEPPKATPGWPGRVV